MESSSTYYGVPEVMELVHPRFLSLAGEPLYAEELADELTLAAIVHEEAVADNEARQPVAASVVAERVAQALYHVYGYPTAGQTLSLAEEMGEELCEGHPAGPSDAMGETVYCDGSCQSL